MPEPLNQQIDRLQEIFFSEKDPTGRAFVPLADAHRRLGELDRALGVLQEGLVAHPDSASGHVVAGWLYRDRGEDDSAIRALERVLELDAENGVALRSLAELVEDSSRGLTYLERLVELEPDDPEVLAALESLQAEVAEASTAAGTEAVAPEEPVVEEALAEAVPVEDAAPLEAAEVSAPDEVALEEPVVEVEPPAEDVAEEPVVEVEPPAEDVAEEPVVEVEPPAEDVAEEPVVEVEPPAEDVAEEPVVEVEPPAEDVLEEPVVEVEPPAEDVLEEPVVEVEPPAEDVAEDEGEIYTQTLAELYAKQGAVDKAVEVYRKLLADDPDNGMFLHRVAELTWRIDTELADDPPLVPIESLAPDPEPVVAEAPVAMDEAPVAMQEEAAAADDRRVVPIESLAPDPDPAEAVAAEPAVPVEDLAPDPEPLVVEPPVADLEPVGSLATGDACSVHDDRPVVPIESLAPDGPSDGEPDDPFPWLNRL